MRFAMVLLLAMAVPKPLTDPVASTLIALERSSWVAWQNHDEKFFDDFLSDDHLEVGSRGPSDKKSVVKVVASGACAVAGYSLDRFSVRQFDANNAVVTYWADQNTTCGTVHVPTPVWATSVYQKRDGQWRNTLYVQTEASSGSKPHQ